MLLLGWICAGCFACLFVFMLAMNKKMYKDLVMYCNMYHAENRKFQIASFVSSKAPVNSASSGIGCGAIRG